MIGVMGGEAIRILFLFWSLPVFCLLVRIYLYDQTHLSFLDLLIGSVHSRVRGKGENICCSIAHLLNTADLKYVCTISCGE